MSHPSPCSNELRFVVCYARRWANWRNLVIYHPISWGDQTIFCIVRRFPVLYRPKKRPAIWDLILILLSISQISPGVMDFWRIEGLNAYTQFLGYHDLLHQQKKPHRNRKIHRSRTPNSTANRGIWRKPFPRWINTYVPTSRYMLRRPDR